MSKSDIKLRETKTKGKGKRKEQPILPLPLDFDDESFDKKQKNEDTKEITPRQKSFDT
jgi:hypothetical protein